MMSKLNRDKLVTVVLFQLAMDGTTDKYDARSAWRNAENRVTYLMAWLGLSEDDATVQVVEEIYAEAMP